MGSPSFYFATSLAFNAPDGRVNLGRPPENFCKEVKGWLRYKMAKKYCQKFQPLSRALEHYKRQTDDRRVCDSKYPNVT